MPQPHPHQLPQPPLDQVIVEMGLNEQGQPFFNVQGRNLQAPPHLLWERIIVILQGGLRAAIVQTVTPPPEPSRIVQPGFLLAPSGGH